MRIGNIVGRKVRVECGFRVFVVATAWGCWTFMFFGCVIRCGLVEGRFFIRVRLEFCRFFGSCGRRKFAGGVFEERV